MDSLLSFFFPRVIPEDGLLVIFLLRAREGEITPRDVDRPTRLTRPIPLRVEDNCRNFATFKHGGRKDVVVLAQLGITAVRD